MAWEWIILSCLMVSVTSRSIRQEPTPEEYLLSTNQMPEDLRLIPAVGNGHLATQVYHDTIYMNSVFNGYRVDSHRARIPSTLAIDVSVQGHSVTSDTYTLDMKKGIFFRDVDYDDNVHVEQRIYAHRRLTRVLVNEFTVTKPDESGDIIIELHNNRGNESEDINLADAEHDELTMYTTGSIKQQETNQSSHPGVHQYWTKIPDSVTLDEESGTWRYLTSISITQDDALSAYNEASAIDQEELLQQHIDAWADIWDSGRVEMTGNMTLAQTINACFFHIYISSPDQHDAVNPFAGLSPGGLARGGKINTTYIGGAYNDYAGHVFWDMDTWIMPPIMMLQPHMANIMITARSRVLDAVRARADTIGYAGIQYPWEQAYTGYETCPWHLAALYQVHVTADVAYSIRQYLYSTGDVSMVNDQHGREMALDIARFWESRSVYENDRYEIHGVMGPDEYAYNVNNSVYTNYQAILSLTLPQYMMDEWDISFDESERAEIEQFNNIAENMYIPFDEEQQFHPQFDGFDHINSTIKQSDVVLLGYPLMKPMTREVRHNDLVIYEELTDPTGPDTGTWSMHTVGWLELGNWTKANEMFAVMFRNVNGPFKIFSEKPAYAEDGMRATNFITGMGGMLQAVLFGYAGIRVRGDSMDIDPYLLPDVTSWNIRGYKYLRSSLDIEISDNDVTVTLKTKDEGAFDLVIVIGSDETALEIDEPVTYQRGPATIKKLIDTSDDAGASVVSSITLLAIMFFSVAFFTKY